jgi:hypothetical protein
MNKRGLTKSFYNLTEYKSHQLFFDSKKYYSPGWENSGVFSNPQLNDKYRPSSNGPAANGAVALPSDWPGRDGGLYRGAVPPLQLKSPTKLRHYNSFSVD